MYDEAAGRMRIAANEMNEAASKMGNAIDYERLSRFTDEFSASIDRLQRIATVNVKLASMLALNEKRASEGHSQAYTEDAIYSLLNEF